LAVEPLVKQRQILLEIKVAILYLAPKLLLAAVRLAIHF
jgi:hypothetical protein